MMPLLACGLDRDGSPYREGHRRITVLEEEKCPSLSRAGYNSDGSLDAGFGSGGRVTTNIGPDANSIDMAYAVAVQADGKIVAAGRGAGTPDRAPDFALARYNPDGTLDTAFDLDGKVTTDGIGGSYNEASAVAVQADGKIVAAGLDQGTVSGTRDFALVRYNADGSLDTSFDGDGRVFTDYFGTSDEARAIALQGDGKIVVAGLNRDQVETRSFRPPPCG